MIFTARQLQEKCQEQNVDLYMTFVDFTKAFDIAVMGLGNGSPPRLIAMALQFHDGMHTFRMMESILHLFRRLTGSNRHQHCSA